MFILSQRYRVKFFFILTFLHWASYFDLPVLTFLFWMAFSDYVIWLFWPSYFDPRILTFLSWPSYFDFCILTFFIMTFLFWPSYSDRTKVGIHKSKYEDHDWEGRVIMKKVRIQKSEYISQNMKVTMRRSKYEGQNKVRASRTF